MHHTLIGWLCGSPCSVQCLSHIFVGFVAPVHLVGSGTTDNSQTLNAYSYYYYYYNVRNKQTTAHTTKNYYYYYNVHTGERVGE